MAITIKSYNQILGDLVRKVIADTPLSDLNDGSALFTLLEGLAGNDFDNNVTALSVLELLSADNTRNTNLDDRASNLGLTRNKAQRSTGYIEVSDSAITKRSSGLYPVKAAPFIGSTKLHVLDASDWASTGTVFIGRGSATFEGPIAYTSITDNTTYFTINLSAALQKNHLLSEIVIDAQGTTNRLVSAGSTISIQANNTSPALEFTTLRDAVIPAGEDSLDNIEAVAVLAGVASNANIGTITTFSSLPFSTATVTNTSAFTGGKNVESDADLRNRIKAYSASLARGTNPAILNALIGLFDTVENKQIKSAVVVEPPESGTPSIVYLDDGSAFEPSFAGQAVDPLITAALGDEEYLQLSNSPLPRPQLISSATGLLELLDGSFLRVVVDEQEETITFETADFIDISSASLAEIVSAINARASLFKARLTNSSQNILIYTAATDAETIRVTELADTDESTLYVNSTLKFPTKEASYIKLYVNGELLQERETSASVTTNVFNVWSISTTQTLSIQVDSSPVQNVSFATSDFDNQAFSELTSQDWADLLPYKISGISVEVLSTDQLKITSNKIGSTSAISILGGTIVSPWFDGDLLESVGKESDFTLNRHTGSLKLLVDLSEDDEVTAGAEDVKGHVLSIDIDGEVDLGIDSDLRPANIVVVSDAEHFAIRPAAVQLGQTITVSEEDSTTVRFMSSTLEAFTGLLAGPNEYLYVTNRGDDDGTGSGDWVDLAACGLMVIKAKGQHTVAGTDSYIEVQTNIPAGTVIAGTYTVEDENDIRAFTSDTFPQVWAAASMAAPGAATIDDIVESINTELSAVKAIAYTNANIKVTSTTEDGGSIAIPVVTGKALLVFTASTEVVTGYDSHIANITEDKDGFAWFKRSTSYDSGTSYPVWLDRTAYSDLSGALSSEAEIETAGSYEKELSQTSVLQDGNVEPNSIIFTTKGPSKGHIANVAQLLSGDTVGTQWSKYRAQFDDTGSSTSEISLAEPLQFSSSDRLVVRVDQDDDKNITTPLFRTGKVNSGSQSLVFTPTATAFSASDADGETGIDFGSSMWGTAIYPTNFADYKVLFRARNWYSAGGHGSGGGTFLVRASKYGPIGEKLRFSLEYPTLPDQDEEIVEDDSNITYSTISYVFASEAEHAVNPSGDIDVTSLGSNLFRYDFSAGTFTSVQVGDIMSILPASGISTDNCGQFKIAAIHPVNKTVDVYNPNAALTTADVNERMTITTIADTAGSLDGDYFVIYSQFGAVAVWYDVDANGTSEPAHGQPYSLRISTVVTGDSAANVAARTYSALADYQINNEPVFSGSVLSNVVTIDAITVDGGTFNVPPPAAGTSGFTVATTVQGSDGLNETIVSGSHIHFFPVTPVSVADLVTAVNEGTSRLELVGTGTTSLEIDVATKEDTYAPGAGYAASLAYGHDPDPTSGLHSYIALYDSQNWILSNSSSNANFTLKESWVLVGASTAYTMHLSPNNGTATLGEYFKLVPSTVENFNHHLNHPALSQMSIITDIETVKNSKRTQLKSKQLGSSGALEVSSGTGNNSVHVVQGTGVSVDAGGSNYLEIKVPASDTLNVGDLVKLENNEGVNRLSRWTDGLTSVDVEEVSNGVFRYILNPKYVVRDYDTVTVTDESASYGRSANSVFKATVTDFVGYPLTEITGDVNGVATAPAAYNATSGASALLLVDKTRGTVSTPQKFRIYFATITAVQSFYVHFYDAAGTTWAVWISVDGDLTEPTGAPYNTVAAGRKLKLAVLSTDTKLQLQDKLSVLINTASASLVSSSFTAETISTVALDAEDINTGDLLVIEGLTTNAYGNGNVLGFTGSDVTPGFPVVFFDAAAPGTFNFLNPHGAAFSQKAELLGLISIIAPPSIKFQLGHSVPAQITSVTLSGTVATVVTSQPHGLIAADGFTIKGIAGLGSPVTGTVSTAPNSYTFTYALVQTAATYTGGTVYKTSTLPTKYWIESLGHNDLFKVRWTGVGNSPKFLDNGVALDDYAVISGSSFTAANNGTFRVRGVSNDAIIVQNASGVEELHDDQLWLNDFNTAVDWTNGSLEVEGTAGDFKNLVVGAHIKKESDPDSSFRIVEEFDTGVAATATVVTLTDTYPGVTSTEEGVYFVTFGGSSGVSAGKALLNQGDLSLYEGDSVMVGDSLYVSNQADTAWFSADNTGTFTVNAVGVTSDFRPYIEVSNPNGVEETDIDLSINPNGFVVQEALANKLDSVRSIANIIPDSENASLNKLYLFPADHADKFSEANATTVTALGKPTFSSIPAVGVDGYLYYTGLLRNAQRTINGFDPDLASFPGRKSVGASIELLPPLVKQVTLALDLSTNNGVVLNNISPEVKSVIISYVLGLGVGENVVLSEIIARVMRIRGVAAVTFTSPEPSEERIVISSNEKAFIDADGISLG